MSDHPDDRDLLAGTYALGVLDRAESAEVEAAMATDPTLRAAVADWEARLAPLASVVPPVAPPPDLWVRIVASAGLGAMASRDPLLRRTWRSTPFWRATTAAALAMAAAFAAVAFLHGPTPAERLVAALGPPGAPAAVFMAEVQPDGHVLIRPLGPVNAVASDKDLELWALPAGATRPVSLGVLPPIGRNLPARELLAANTQLMISLEPLGGSRTGAPTGPVLWGGRLAPVE
jgi:anti-sigma-K factor RskA